ncbi:hypothetical protein FH972_023264 [Carpinus fangiana]|uniref:C2H2-type domain-containing protein n=1 Tax=Carpinus fangiana TaxID=176857 RepID=A0A5N6KUQ1_9ROSI|nr:hypothetical protein FH972_023264 [Carpinus fangiana]
MSAATHPYTCNTCQVAFKGSEMQRGHMQSDWHRYNLKRRVASLPPLTSEIFNEKVLATQATAAASAARASFERVCGACSRTYFSENAYSNHLNSQKHKVKVAQLASVGGEDFETNSMMSSAFSLGESMDLKSFDGQSVTSKDDAEGDLVAGLQNTQLSKENVEIVESDSEDDEDDASTTDGKDDVSIVQRCLFCNNKADTPQANVAHMRSTHGMFIPEKDYLVDLPGLLEHLYTRVSGLHECLFCGTVKYTTSGIQTHMRDKGHCMIAFESEEEMIEVGQFYDFSSTYSDPEDADDTSDEDEGAARGGGVKLGGKRAAKYTNEDGDEAYEDGEWESDEDDEDMDDDDDEEDEGSEAAGATAAKPAKAHRKPRPAETTPIYHDEFELHLPSGRSVGHRSLARYYRQNLHNYPVTPEERAARLAIRDDSDNEDTRGPARGRAGRTEQAVIRANGGLGMLGVSEQKKAELRATELKQVKRAKRAENQLKARVEKRANNQKHFRDPLLQ